MCLPAEHKHRLLGARASPCWSLPKPSSAASQSMSIPETWSANDRTVRPPAGNSVLPYLRDEETWLLTCFQGLALLRGRKDPCRVFSSSPLRDFPKDSRFKACLIPWPAAGVGGYGISQFDRTLGLPGEGRPSSAPPLCCYYRDLSGSPRT